MKILKTLSTLFVLLMISSCSPKGDIVDVDDDSVEISDKDSFVYAFENKDTPITTWLGSKSESTIAVVGRGDNDILISFVFDIHGNLGEVTVDSGEKDDVGFSETYGSFEYFKSNYFNFELIGIDEIKKRVAVKFSGDLYEDRYDIASETRYVEGRFNVEYIDVIPAISGLEVSAEINGSQWVATDSDSSGGFVEGSNIELNHFNGSQYFISYTINNDNTTPGIYNFNKSSTVNKVSFSRYDPDTNEFVVYETSGVLNIKEKNDLSIFIQIIGEYSFTATNGSEVIEVTNGKINTIFSNY